MSIFERSFENPILVPYRDYPWEADGAFNGCPVRSGAKIHLLYRAQSLPLLHDEGEWLSISSIGHSESLDGTHFKEHRPFIEPEEHWERFGCEDPRVTRFEGKYYTFYTALGGFPFGPDNIKSAVAVSRNFRSVDERHLVTPFNAKAMSLFPERIGGKIWVILTADTDRKPSKIALASFDSMEQLWDEARWKRWYERIDEHILPLARDEDDQVEIGAPPVRTKEGWLLFYSHIDGYGTDRTMFGIEAVLLDLDDPKHVIGRSRIPLLVPEEEYEEYGKVRDIVFPSGALVRGNTVSLYYGAADTTTCVATGKLDRILEELTRDPEAYPRFERFSGNPVLEPVEEHDWEAKAVFNPAAITDDEGTVRLLYRTLASDDTSYFGYAESRDGFSISERLPDPAYGPRAEFEKKKSGGNSGVEDPRITRIGNTCHLLYTAVDAAGPPRVAYSSIPADDFFARRFERFACPKLVSPPEIDDKDAVLFPEKIGGKYVLLHRIQPSIDINFRDDLDFGGGPRDFLTHNPFIFPRRGMWDSAKVGINTVPLKTKEGWLVFYHGVSKTDHNYRVGAVLLDLEHPDRVIGRTRHPLFEPEEPYEKEGVVPNVVFPCGSVIKGDDLVIYYGGADRVVGVASTPLRPLIKRLLRDGF